MTSKFYRERERRNRMEMVENEESPVRLGIELCRFKIELFIGFHLLSAASLWGAYFSLFY